MRRTLCGCVALLLLVGAGGAEVRLLRDGASMRLEYHSAASCGDRETALVGLPPGATPRLVLVETEPSTCAEAEAAAPAQLSALGDVRRQRVARVTFNPGGDHRRVVIDLEGLAPPPAVTARRESRAEAAFYERLLVNPRSARRWRSASAFPVAAAARPVAVGDWYRLTVTKSGVYRVRARDLPGWQGGASDALAIYTTEGAPLRPFADTAPASRRALDIVVDDGGDGRFAGDDELFFYGEATSGWAVTGDVWAWRHNPYTADRVYWLATGSTQGARRGARREADPDGVVDAADATTHVTRLHVEQDNAPLHVAQGGIPSGKAWYWLTTVPGDRPDFLTPLSAPVASPLQLRLGLVSKATGVQRLGVLWDGRAIGFPAISPGDSLVWTARAVALDPEGAHRLELVHQSGTQVFFDWFEVIYERQLRSVAGELLFEAAEERRRYQVSGFEGASPVAFAVDGQGGLAPVLGGRHDADAGTFVFADDGGALLRFVVLEPRRLRTPEIAAADPDRLLTGYAGADYVIITPEGFATAARRLADWRAVEDRRDGPLQTAVVDVQGIYDAFGGGHLDPTAIRNFLRWTFGRSPTPRFVVLFGDGSYDYRDNSGVAAASNWIPPHEERDSTYDEFFVRVTPGAGFADMAIGRLPVHTAAEADMVVDKLIDYDREPASGHWRSRVLLVADDTYNPDRPGLVETFFTTDAETLATRLPEELDLSKLYLVEFPREGRFKPRAGAAFIDAFNEGAALLTWVGHGNSSVFAHEHIFVLSRDLGLLRNGGRLPFMYAAASQMGVFDDPSRDSVPEALVRHAAGGAIGMIAATRVGFHGSNMELARRFHERLFAGGWQATTTVGEALWEAKLLTNANPSNVRRYSLFGDPAMRLALPELEVRLEAPDTLSALDVVRVRGQVVESGQVVSDLDGEVRLQVFDSTSQRRLVEQGREVMYERLGSALFRGLFPVEAGRFVADIPVPRDITYRGRNGRVSAFVSGPSGTAFGIAAPLVLSGTKDAAPSDDDGPRIDIGFVGHTFDDGGRVPSGAVLRATLHDASGINVTGEVGHGITLYVGARRIDATEAFVAQGDYRVGEILHPLGDTPPGDYTVRLEAWDTRNNWAVESVDVVVVAAGGPIAELRYHPNPQRGREGVFSYRLEEAAEAVRIRVFSVSGRQIDSIRGPAESGANQVSWPTPTGLANGTYLVRAETLGGASQGQEHSVLVVAR